MTWTYTPEESRTLDQVRLYIGDTDEADQQLSDEEIAFLLTNEGEAFRAAAAAAFALAAQVARKVTVQVDEKVRANLSDLQAHYMALGNDLRKRGARRGLTPLAGGISHLKQEVAEEDTDRIEPAFERDMFTEPGTSIDDEDDPFPQAIPN